MIRIFKNESYKLFSSVIFWIIIIISLLFVCYLNVFGTNIEISDSEYRNFYSELDTYQEISTQMDLVSKIIKETVANSEKEFQQQNKIHFYSSQFEYLESLKEYDTYLNTIKQNSVEMSSISIFADENSFEYRNITTIPAAYENVSDVTPVAIRSATLTLIAENKSVDISLVILSIISSIILFGKECENGILRVIRPLKYGRKYLCFIKLLVLFLVSLISGIFLLLITGYIAYIRFGSVNLFCPVQSVEGYIQCNYSINILQFIIINYSLKITTAFLISVLFSILCMKFHLSYSILITAIISIVEISVYIFIPFTSKLSIFSSANFVAFLNCNELFKTYRCINIFNYPVNNMAIVFISMLFLFIVLNIVALQLFENIPLTEKLNKLRRFALSAKVSSKPFSYAFYKSMVMHKGVIVIAAVLIFQLFHSIRFNPEYNLDDMNYKFYCEKISEMSHNEAEIFIEAEQNKFNSALNTLSTSILSTYEIIQISKILNYKNGFEKAIAQYEYINDLDSSKKKLFYLSGWNEIFGVNGFKNDMKLALIELISLCVMILPIVAYDRKHKLIYLLNTTYLGKKKYIINLFQTSSITAIIVFLIVNFPNLWALLSYYGLNGYNYSIQCLPELNAYPDIPIYSYILILFGIRIIELCLFSFFLIGISYISKSPASALCLGLSIFLLPVLLYLVGYEHFINFCFPLSGNREIKIFYQ